MSQQPLLSQELFPCFRRVPKTGVIYVMAQARKLGFEYGNPEWANLGQGAPECGPLPDAPDRLESIELPAMTHEYGPVGGVPDLREAVARLYNQRYRKGKASQYTAENVAISSGGRLGLTRICATLGSTHLGHFLPDYTAYEELLDIFRNFVPIPVLLHAREGFKPEHIELKREIMGRGLGALLVSNPCNPTGQLLRDGVLKSWVEISRELQCALIFDEFYAHYLYGGAARSNVALSACAYVENVDEDPVIILDGLTKNWRYPGLRLAWTVGPREVINRVISAGSFLDGGPPHALQKAVIPLLEPAVADQEARAIQKAFSLKRSLMIQELEQMGFRLHAHPEGTFYCFASLEDLPEPLRDGMNFFHAALQYKVISVPGIFFDVNPGKRRSHIPSRLKGYVRLSFGPSLNEVQRGLEGIKKLIHEKAK